MEGRILHSSQYRACTTPPKTVVVGFGKSAVDIAYSVACKESSVRLVHLCICDFEYGLVFIVAFKIRVRDYALYVYALCVYCISDIIFDHFR